MNLDKSTPFEGVTAGANTAAADCCFSSSGTSSRGFQRKHTTIRATTITPKMQAITIPAMAPPLRTAALLEELLEELPDFDFFPELPDEFGTGGGGIKGGGGGAGEALKEFSCPSLLSATLDQY